MNKLVIVGMVLGACVSVIDRFLYKIPSKPAVALYLIASGLILAGAIISRA